MGRKRRGRTRTGIQEEKYEDSSKEVKDKKRREIDTRILREGRRMGSRAEKHLYERPQK